jgi:hypothetical protein
MTNLYLVTHRQPRGCTFDAKSFWTTSDCFESSGGQRYGA